MVLWRISNQANLSGLGGLYASARWHTGGQSIVYLAEHPAAAILEVLVHLEMNEEEWPSAYQLLKVEADDRLAHGQIDLSSLPNDWRTNELLTQSLGDDWLKRKESALLRVPSAITPETWNWLLNPRHEEAKNVFIVHMEQHLYDSRLFHA